ncbi:ATP/GTP-binding protein [Flavobacterium ginsenosidimutans]|uniref:ATP-binding protein n=1 Tax=Flavobacterium ginsenosidimutans TaxID=687844 RepID=A0ABZ2QD50_9FLAO|nr:ATP-binding protein [Flavobacterium ginsenosidimutans]KAF2333527.1 ATP-binding protein [Flavobacterium ginsenosidimutans]
MRIVILGAHLVGKTTLAEKLHESLPDYEFYPEPYFELQEMGFVFSEMPTADDYMMQLEYSLKQIVRSDRNAIFDRCPIDLLGYALAVDDTLNFSSIFNKIQNAIKEIDVFVFVPIEEPDRISCSDSNLPELRNNVNDIIGELIDDFEIEVIKVKGSLSERLNQIQNKIQQKF